MEYLPNAEDAPRGVVKHGVDVPENIEVRWVCTACGGKYRCVFGADTTEGDAFPRKNDDRTKWNNEMFVKNGRCPFVKGYKTRLKRINGDALDAKQ